jgi:hypothetical protein
MLKALFTLFIDCKSLVYLNMTLQVLTLGLR